MAFEHVTSPLSITMWDFSWLERRWPGAEYEDWSAVLDGLVERGYDAVRIDAYPHLIAADPTGSWTLLPVWDQHPWGSPAPISVSVQPALNDFVRACRDRGVLVALSTWFREDTHDVRMNIRTPEDQARVWRDTLRTLDADGLLENVLYVDLCNEFPLPLWTPFLYRDTRGGNLSRHRKDVRSWMEESIELLRTAYPQLPYCYSLTSELWQLAAEDPPSDFLETHVWMAKPEVSDFYARIGYDVDKSRFDPVQAERVAGRGRSEYWSAPEFWESELVRMIDHLASCAEQTGKPLATTECWGVVNYRDDPGVSWDWIRRLGEVGTRRALHTGRWSVLATSNFCGPQFGMWSDVAWHRKMTDEIRGAQFRHPQH